MLYRRFGRTNLQMPVFSCGGMRYQHKWQDTPLSEIPADNQANLEATIRAALAAGINHIETARGYGSSERQLGVILPKFPRHQLIVQTKVGPEADADNFTRNVEESLARLQLAYVDLLGIHGINNAETLDWATRPNGCLAAARKLQARGLVRHVGFSTHGAPEIITSAIRCDRDGGFDYVNLHWYYIYQRNWPAIEDATRQDMGVFIISPSDKGGMLYQPTDKMRALCRPLHPLVFNDLFCLSRLQVHTLSVGASRPGDFDLHVEAAELLPRVAEVLPPILARLQGAYVAAVPANQRDPFAALPSFEATPGQINAAIILWLLNLGRAFDLIEYGQMRYNLLGNGGHWFPGQNAAGLDDVDLAPIAKAAGIPELVDLLREAHRLFGKEAIKRLSQR